MNNTNITGLDWTRLDHKSGLEWTGFYNYLNNHNGSNKMMVDENKWFDFYYFARLTTITNISFRFVLSGIC